MAQFDVVLDTAIDSTASAYLDNPANVSDERALAEDVRSRLNAIFLPASVMEVTVEESSGASGDVTDHEAYTGRYRDTERIDRAQCEIGGSAFPFGETERLDLAVFSDDLSITISNGTQEFIPEDLIAAVEFKYVKNINYLRYRPDDDHSKYQDIAEDIVRLGALPDGVDRRCVVFSNYDLLRRDREAEQHLEQLADRDGVNLRFVVPNPVD